MGFLSGATPLCSFIFTLLSVTYILNIFYGRRLSEFPGLLRDRPSSWDLPITWIQPQIFRDGEWLLNALRQLLITWFVSHRKHRCWLGCHIITVNIWQLNNARHCLLVINQKQNQRGFQASGERCVPPRRSVLTSVLLCGGRRVYCRHVGYAHWLHHQGEIYMKTLW